MSRRGALLIGDEWEDRVSSIKDGEFPGSLPFQHDEKRDEALYYKKLGDICQLLCMHAILYVRTCSYY